MLEFFMPMKSPPTATHQEKKVNFKTKSFYEPNDVKKARMDFLDGLAPNRPFKKLKGPMRLTTKWCYPSKDGHSGYRTEKPDCDNMVKLMIDCMAQLKFFDDDKEISSLIIEKFDVKDPPIGIYIKLEEL